MSTPGSPAGVFYSIHSKATGFEDWWTRHVRLEEAISAGRISAVWAEARKRQWGESSAVYKNRVLGEFPHPMRIRLSRSLGSRQPVDRWEAWHASGEDPGPVTHLGVDVARMGTDQTVLALRAAGRRRRVRRFSHSDVMATTGRVVGVLAARPSMQARYRRDRRGRRLRRQIERAGL